MCTIGSAALSRRETACWTAELGRCIQPRGQKAVHPTLASPAGSAGARTTLLLGSPRRTSSTTSVRPTHDARAEDAVAGQMPTTGLVSPVDRIAPVRYEVRGCAHTEADSALWHASAPRRRCPCGPRPDPRGLWTAAIACCGAPHMRGWMLREMLRRGGTLGGRVPDCGGGDEHCARN